MEMINRMMDNETEKIEVFGARVHNLKNVDVELPRNSLTVIEREWEVFIGFRYDIRRRSASLHRNIFGIRA